MIGEIRKLRVREMVAMALVFLSLISPGFLLIYRYQITMIKDLDIAKLIVFSLALTLPFFIVQLVMITTFVKKSDELSVQDELLASAVSTAVGMYFALTMAYLGNWPFKSFLVLAFGFLVVVGISARWMVSWAKRGK